MEEQGGKNHHCLYMDKFRRLIAKTLTTPPPPPVFDTSPTLPPLVRINSNTSSSSYSNVRNYLLS